MSKCIFHNYETIEETEKWKTLKCKKCGKVVNKEKFVGGYQPGYRSLDVSEHKKIPPLPIMGNKSLCEEVRTFVFPTCEHKGEYSQLLNYVESIYRAPLRDYQCEIIKRLCYACAFEECEEGIDFDE